MNPDLMLTIQRVTHAISKFATLLFVMLRQPWKPFTILRSEVSQYNSPQIRRQNGALALILKLRLSVSVYFTIELTGLAALKWRSNTMNATWMTRWQVSRGVCFLFAY